MSAKKLAEEEVFERREKGFSLTGLQAVRRRQRAVGRKGPILCRAQRVVSRWTMVGAGLPGETNCADRAGGASIAGEAKRRVTRPARQNFAGWGLP